MERIVWVMRSSHALSMFAAPLIAKLRRKWLRCVQTLITPQLALPKDGSLGKHRCIFPGRWYRRLWRRNAGGWVGGWDGSRRLRGPSLISFVRRELFHVYPIFSRKMSVGKFPGNIRSGGETGKTTAQVVFRNRGSHFDEQAPLYPYKNYDDWMKRERQKLEYMLLHNNHASIYFAFSACFAYLFYICHSRDKILL